MKLPFEFNTNAVKDTVSQMGGLIKSASGTALTLFKGWFTGDGPLAHMWSGIMSAWDVMVNKIKGTAEEKPGLVLGVSAAVVVALIFVGPYILGKGAAGAAKAAGTAAGGVVGGVKNAIKSLWR